MSTPLAARWAHQSVRSTRLRSSAEPQTPQPDLQPCNPMRCVRCGACDAAPRVMQCAACDAMRRVRCNAPRAMRCVRCGAARRSAAQHVMCTGGQRRCKRLARARNRLAKAQRSVCERANMRARACAYACERACTNAYVCVQTRDMCGACMREYVPQQSYCGGGTMPSMILQNKSKGTRRNTITKL